MKYIVQFKEKVKADYNCRYKTNIDYCQRFETYEEARQAAKDFCKTIPELPYRRSALVFNGPVITCPWTAYFETKILKYAHKTGKHLKAPAVFKQLFNMIF